MEENEKFALFDMHIARIRTHSEKLNKDISARVGAEGMLLREIEIIGNRLYQGYSLDENWKKDLLNKLKDLKSFVSKNKGDDSHNQKVLEESIGEIIIAFS